MPTTTGEIQSVSTTFTGTVIHLPSDVVNTIVRLPYKEEKSVSHGRNKIPMQYVGRKFPVFDFGIERTEEVSQTAITIFEMPNYATIMRQMRSFMDDAISSICYRDARGRVIFGTITEYEESEIPLATSISFKVSRADYSEAV